jgi:hypothetical protein
MRALGSALLAPQDRARWIRVIQLAEAHTILQFLLRNVLWCGVVLLYATDLLPGTTGTGSAWSPWLLAWTLAPLAPFLLTSLRDFRFLGEAERYPEYAIAPAAVLGGLALQVLPVGLRSWVLVGYLVTLVLAEAYTFGRLRWNAGRQKTRALDELVAYLAAQPATTVAVPLPWHLAFQLAADVRCSFIAAIDASVWCRDYAKLFVKYPWLRSDLSHWRSSYNASLVVVDSTALRVDAPPAYDFSPLRQVFDNGAFQVFEWPGDAGSRG